MYSDDDKTRTRVTLTSGTMVSHYRIIEKIGGGGMVDLSDLSALVNYLNGGGYVRPNCP